MTITKLGKDESDNIVELGFEERKSHVEVIGSTGVGKTTFLTGLFLQDIIQGKSGAYFDPDGDALHALLRRLPKEKLDKVFWFDPNNNKFPPINLLYCPDISDPAEVTASAEFAMHIFQRLWEITNQTPRLENLLRNCFIALAYNNMTLADIPELLDNPAFRAKVIAKIPDVHSFVKWFWEKRYNGWSDYLKEERTEPTLTRVLEFLDNTFIRRIVEQNGLLNFRQAMKDGHVFLFRLAPNIEGQRKGIGNKGVRLLGTMLMALILDAAMTRAEGERNFFSLVVDEFHLFATSDFETILTRLRKYGVAATLGYQYRGQLDDCLNGAVAQTGTKVVFRLTPKDAPEFAPMFAREAPPAETRKEQEISIHRQPLEWLQQGHRHRNPRINALFEKYITPFLDYDKQMIGRPKHSI